MVRRNHIAVEMRHYPCGLYSVAKLVRRVVTRETAYLRPHKYADDTKDTIWSWMILDDNLVMIVQASVLPSQVESVSKLTTR